MITNLEELQEEINIENSNRNNNNRTASGRQKKVKTKKKNFKSQKCSFEWRRKRLYDKTT